MTYHVLKLAHRGTPAQTLTSAAAPVMQELSTRINQSCHLVVRSGTQGLVILRQENQRRHANLSVRLGAVIELASSCSGQVLLAHLDPAEREQSAAIVPRPRGNVAGETRQARSTRSGSAAMKFTRAPSPPA